jgi:DNA polymerase-3 subunit epsilon
MRILDEAVPIYTYSSIQEGKQHLFNLVEKFGLCQKLCGLYETNGACFQYQIHQCEGACIGEETSEDYNLKVNQAIENYHFDNDNFFIIGTGRSKGERSVVKIEHGKYIGFGFFEASGSTDDVDRLHDCIKPQLDNKEVRQIINSFLKKNTPENIVTF